MIQELLGAAGLIGGDRKISINGTILEPHHPSRPICSPPPPPPPPPPPTTTTTKTAATTSSSTTNNNNNKSNNTENQNLRCPRCDSSNTKFCYYNNYNLTQPRHFCKTCRRYWTKGGALRNVPIGGGCRKNKSTSSSVSNSLGKSSSAKTMVYENIIGRSSGLINGFDHPSNIMWGSPQNSHILSLLRSTTALNPTTNSALLSNSDALKEDGNLIGNSQMASLDPLTQQLPYSLGLCSPLWKNNNNPNELLAGQEVHQNSSVGFPDLYQRLKSSAANYYGDHTPSNPANLNANVASSSTSSTVAGGELGYSWNNPGFSWSDLSTPNNGTAFHN